MNKPIFVSVTADDCPPCSNYKKTLETELINNTLLEPSKHWKDLLTVYRINVERRDVALIRDLAAKKGLNPEIENYIVGYPCFMLFTPASWNNTRGKLEGEVFGSIITRVNGKIILNNNPSQPFILTIDAMTNWLTGILNQDRFKTINAPKVTQITPEIPVETNKLVNTVNPIVQPKATPWVTQINSEATKIVVPKNTNKGPKYKIGRPEGI